MSPAPDAHVPGNWSTEALWSNDGTTNAGAIKGRGQPGKCCTATQFLHLQGTKVQGIWLRDKCASWSYAGWKPTW